MCSDLCIDLEDSCVLRTLQNLQKMMTEFTVKEATVFRVAIFLNKTFYVLTNAIAEAFTKY